MIVKTAAHTHGWQSGARRSGNPKVRGIFEVQPFMDLMRQRRENELPIFCKTCSRYEGTADHRVQLLDEATVEIKILDDKILQLLLQPLSCNQTGKSSEMKILIQRHIVNGNGLGASSWDASDIGYKRNARDSGRKRGKGWGNWVLCPMTCVRRGIFNSFYPIIAIVWAVRIWNPRTADRSLKEWGKWLFAGNMNLN